MIKNVNISEDKDSKYVVIDIECEESSGVKSIQAVCLPEKAQQAQEFVFKVMQMLSLPQRVTNAAGMLGELFAKKNGMK